MDYYANACQDIPPHILAEIEHRRDHPPRPWYRKVNDVWVSLRLPSADRRTPTGRDIELIGKLWASSVNGAMGTNR